MIVGAFCCPQLRDFLCAPGMGPYLVLERSDVQALVLHLVYIGATMGSLGFRIRGGT